MKKICVMAEASGFGGAEVHTLNLIRYLGEHNHSIEFVSFNNQVFDPLVASLHNCRYDKINLSTSAATVDLRNWEDILAPLQSDTVILQKTHYAMGSTSFLRSLRKKFKKMYYIEHSVSDAMPRKTSKQYLCGLIKGLGLWWYREKYKRMRRFAFPDRVVAVSRATAHALVSDCFCDARKISVLPNGVVCGRFRPDQALRSETRRRFNIPQRQLLFGMVTRLAKGKGVDIAIEAFRSMRAEENVRLMIVGEGDLEGSFHELAAQYGLGDRVIFTGFQVQTEAYFNAIDFLLMPSSQEAFPYSLLEGMACGCIPIVTDVGGMPEVVNQSNGLLLDADDLTENLVQAMKDVLRYDQPTRSRKQENAIRTIRENYSLEKSLDSIGKLLWPGMLPGATK
jgi:glycosyltransferase involved in cell wall biosynthesis